MTAHPYRDPWRRPESPCQHKWWLRPPYHPGDWHCPGCGARPPWWIVLWLELTW